MQQLQCSRKKIQSSTYSHSKKPTQAVSFSINIIHLHFKWVVSACLMHIDDFYIY